MKTTTIIALVSGVGQVAATFRNARPFSCPSNTIEECDIQQQNGFDWQDLADGFFSNYGGFDFNGFECKSGLFGKRDGLTGRAFGSKAAYGVAERNGGSSFGCGQSREVEKFSIVHFDISVEFDVDLEFHYDMADGSKCKHRSRCSRSGTTVKNSQCGGAKNVTVIYPSQEAQPAPSCSFGIHSMSFACGTPTATLIATTPAATASTSVEATTTSEAEETTTSSTEETTTTEEAGVTTTAEATETTSADAVETTTAEVEETTSTDAIDITSTETAQLTEITSTLVTSFLSTSTVFETSVVTVTSCGPAVVDCPAGNPDNTVVIVTQTIAVSTTLCPVTETMTIIETTQAVEDTTSVDAIGTTTSQAEEATTTETEEATTTETKEVATTETDGAGTTETDEATTTTTEAEEGTTTKAEPTEIVETTSADAVETTTTTTDSAQAPLETLPCPGVVPSCINTWLFTVGCSSNTDQACYCPDTAFVQNIFSCIYSYGETDTIISEAVIFFQGICAGHVEENPAIVTGAETVTTVITVTPTAIPTAVYTTIEVVKTTVVPCEENGTTIPDSSTTITISTEMTVPQVTFATTVEAGETTDVVLVPGTTAIAISEELPVATGTGVPAETYTTLYTKPGSGNTVPIGTGVLPTRTASDLPVQFTGAAAPKGVAFGAIAFGVAGAIVAF